MMCAVLTFINKKYEDRVLLKPGRITVGREGCDLIIEHPEMSNKHCKFEWIQESFQVFDLHSTNGTLVNGARIVKSVLKDGDQLNFGSLKAIFNLAPLNPPYYKTGYRFVHGPLQSFPLESFELPIALSTQVRESINILKEKEAELRKQSQLCIQLEHPNGKAEKVVLPPNDVVLGRTTSVFDLGYYENLSRKHTAVRVLQHGLVGVEDLGSTNGTLVNNEKITELTIVFSTDRVQIGPLEFKIQII